MSSNRTPDIEKLYRWMEIRVENGIPVSMDNLLADIDHSALLGRLLAGKEPFPEPPPRAYSYPNYTLLENGRGEPGEVYERDRGFMTDEATPVLFIDQLEWKIVEKRGPEEWIVSYYITDVEALKKAASTGRMSLGAYVGSLSRKVGRQAHGPQKLASTRWRVFRRGTDMREGYAAEDPRAKLWGIKLV